MGFPIRRSMDQSLFAAPHGFSQRITSFFACACQGIHQMPLRHLIVLIANAHQYSCRFRRNKQQPGYLLQPNHLMMTSTCSFRPDRLLTRPRRAASFTSDHKTSFSRLNPVPRGQATVIRCSIRDLFAHARSDLTVRASRERQTIGDDLSV